MVRDDPCMCVLAARAGLQAEACTTSIEPALANDGQEKRKAHIDGPFSALSAVLAVLCPRPAALLASAPIRTAAEASLQVLKAHACMQLRGQPHAAAAS